MEFIATCPTGFESVLAQELRNLSVPRVRPLQGLVSFEGPISAAYRVCLWSHLASRVVVVLGRGSAGNADELYATVSSVAWEDHLIPTASFAVNASGTNAQLRTTQFTAMRTKDAIVDRMFAQVGVRPRVDPKRPDLHVVVRLGKKNAIVGLDLAGDPLFRRGYERPGLRYGLRPDYASALLTVANWQDLQATSPVIVDASQGPSVLLVEAALLAARRAPGLSRFRWGFQKWALHDPDAWEALVAEARELGGKQASVQLFSSAPKGLSSVRSELRTVGLDLPVLLLPDKRMSSDLLVCDLADVSEEDLVREAAALGDLVGKVRSANPRFVALAGRDDLASAFLRQEPSSTLGGVLGKDPLVMSIYDLASASNEAKETEAPCVLVSGNKVPVLVGASDQFAARLQKVTKARAKWAKSNDVTCYRVYDADLPDYAVSVDLYQGTDPQTGMPSGHRWLQISEYAAPKSVDQLLAKTRLLDALSIAPRILDVEPRNTFLRVRRHGKGGSQYAQEGNVAKVRGRAKHKGDVPLPPGGHLVDEGGLVFEVNFSGRLDCGIFLDHRDTRAMLREMAKQTKGSKRFLNLFGYTGTATCYAADGGMRHTTTVDLSRPSLDWARRNMERNGFSGREHEYVQADVVRWVGEQRHTPNRWDLVFCDVPTFSNSNRMGRRSWDVQRDHAELLIGVSRLLTHDGRCVFSCNLRSFRPDEATLRKAGVVIEDITARTIPEDFSRNQRIHHAYIVRRG